MKAKKKQKRKLFLIQHNISMFRIFKFYFTFFKFSKTSLDHLKNQKHVHSRFLYHGSPKISIL